MKVVKRCPPPIKSLLTFCSRGEGSPNGLESTENKVIYSGVSSSILYTRYYNQIFECTFDLQWFPFDVQASRCPTSQPMSFSVVQRCSSAGKSLRHHNPPATGHLRLPRPYRPHPVHHQEDWHDETGRRGHSDCGHCHPEKIA